MELMSNDAEVFSAARAAGKSRCTYEKLRAELSNGDRIAYFNLESGEDITVCIDEWSTLTFDHWKRLQPSQKAGVFVINGGSLSSGLLAMIRQDVAPVVVKAKKREFNNGPACRGKWWNK